MSLISTVLTFCIRSCVAPSNAWSVAKAERDLRNVGPGIAVHRPGLGIKLWPAVSLRRRR